MLKRGKRENRAKYRNRNEKYKNNILYVPAGRIHNDLCKEITKGKNKSLCVVFAQSLPPLDNNIKKTMLFLLSLEKRTMFYAVAGKEDNVFLPTLEK